MGDRGTNQVGPDVIAAFAQARLALVGFEDDEALSISRFAAAMGSFTHRIVPQTTELSSQMNTYSAILLNLTPGLDETSWVSARRLTEIKTPVLAIGSWADMNRFPTIRVNASELLVRPLWNDELLFRIARAVSKPVAGGTPGIRGSDKGQKFRILIADGDPSMVSLAAGILRGRGMECHEANNGKLALELARTILPDLLILDIHMPLLNGFDILKAIREDPSTSAMKILIFTGDDTHDAVKLAAELGASGYLCKPFRPFDFVRKVKDLLPIGPAIPLFTTHGADAAASSTAIPVPRPQTEELSSKSQ